MRKFIAMSMAVLFGLAITSEVHARGGSSSRSRSPKAGNASKEHPVKGYHKKDGTYVPPHYQTNPNKTQRDNYSSKPNVNPRTGKAGTKTLTQ